MKTIEDANNLAQKIGYLKLYLDHVGEDRRSSKNQTEDNTRQAIRVAVENEIAAAEPRPLQLKLVRQHVKQRRIPADREGNWAIVYEEFDLLRHLNLPVEIDESIETMNVSKQ
jgi:hypothetical protein